MKKLLLLFVLSCIFLCACKSAKKLHSLKQTSYSITTEKEIKQPLDEKYISHPAPLKVGMEASVEEVQNYLPEKQPKITKPTSIIKSIGNKVSIKETRTETRMDIGEVVYKVPDTMVVFVNYNVLVRISKKRGTAEITESMENNVVKKEIPVTAEMSVTLIDSSPDSAFSIKNINSNGQIIDSVDYTEWHFVVQPIKAGQKSLSLVISIMKDGEVKQKVYSDTIHIKNNIPIVAEKFWVKYWQWLATTIIIPLIVYFWKRKK